MKHKQLIDSLRNQWAKGDGGINDLVALVWNAAVEECAEKATTTTKLYDYGDWETETIVDTKSILSLKIEDDEK